MLRKKKGLALAGVVDELNKKKRIPKRYVDCIESILGADIKTTPKGIEVKIMAKLGLDKDNLPDDYPRTSTLRNKVRSVKAKLKMYEGL